MTLTRQCVTTLCKAPQFVFSVWSNGGGFHGSVAEVLAGGSGEGQELLEGLLPQQEERDAVQLLLLRDFRRPQ